MRFLILAAVTTISSALVFAACSDSNSSGGTVPTVDAGSSDTGSSSSSSSSGSSGGGTCSELAQAGVSVDIKAAKPPEPTATGGTPVDGTFVLTAVRAFTDIFPEGNTIQAFGAYTLSIGGSGTTFEQAVTDKDNVLSQAKGALVVNGVNFTATPSCEVPTPEAGATILEGQYTADATTLKMYVVRTGIPAELTFTKQ